MERSLEYLTQLREAVPLTRVVSVVSRRYGENYQARCPWCRADQLVINPRKNIYHCFSCSEGGDIFKWLMKTERWTFEQAVARVEALR